MSEAAQINVLRPATEFVAGLNQNRKDARLLGTELDAALQDPRWKAVGSSGEL